MQNYDPNRPSELREAYLAEVTRRLQNRLAPWEAFDTATELRDHINAMAAAYVEVGMDAESAMVAALEKFGVSSEIGASLAETNRTGMRFLTLSLGIGFTICVTSIVNFVNCHLQLALVTSLYTGIAAAGRDTGMVILGGALLATLSTPFAWRLLQRNPIHCAKRTTLVLGLAWFVCVYLPSGMFRGHMLCAPIMASSLSYFFVSGYIASWSAHLFCARFSHSRLPLTGSRPI